MSSMAALGSISGLEGGLLSRYLRIMSSMAALWLPYRGWRAAFCPDICHQIMSRIISDNFIFRNTVCSTRHMIYNIPT
jgi:hypothetical protein